MADLMAPVDSVDVPPTITEVGRQLRAPWAASIAGLLFAVLFTGALVLLRHQPMITADDQGLADIFASGQDLPLVIILKRERSLLGDRS